MLNYKARLLCNRCQIAAGNGWATVLNIHMVAKTTSGLWETWDMQKPELTDAGWLGPRDEMDRASHHFGKCPESMRSSASKRPWPKDQVHSNKLNRVTNRRAYAASGVTSKAANGGHFKTGQRKWPGTRLFYSVAS